MKLIESEIIQSAEGHIIFRQLIENDSGEAPAWMDQDITGIPDAHQEKTPMKSEDAFLLGVAVALNKEVTEIKNSLMAGEVIHFVLPPGQRTSPAPIKE